VLRAVRESEEADMPAAPGLDPLHDGVDQPGAHTLVPQVWRHGERTEEADAAPARREVGADELSVHRGSERRRRVSGPARVHVVGRLHERSRIRHAEEGSERATHDVVGRGQVVLAEGADADVDAWRGAGCRHVDSSRELVPMRRARPNVGTSVAPGIGRARQRTVGRTAHARPVPPTEAECARPRMSAATTAAAVRECR
jgi:hypothetical protein